MSPGYPFRLRTRVGFGLQRGSRQGDSALAAPHALHEEPTGHRDRSHAVFPGGREQDLDHEFRRRRRWAAAVEATDNRRAG